MGWNKMLLLSGSLAKAGNGLEPKTLGIPPGADQSAVGTINQPLRGCAAGAGYPGSFVKVHYYARGWEANVPDGRPAPITCPPDRVAMNRAPTPPGRRCARPCFLTHAKKGWGVGSTRVPSPIQ
jgi:hypothetical protein